MLTGVASLMADRTGGVMSQLPGRAAAAGEHHFVPSVNPFVAFAHIRHGMFSLLDSRLRVADLGVAGGGRPWRPAAPAEDRNVEK